MNDINEGDFEFEIIYLFQSAELFSLVKGFLLTNFELNVSSVACIIKYIVKCTKNAHTKYLDNYASFILACFFRIL